MNIAGTGKRVRVYIGESDQWRSRPLFLEILELLRAEGCAGATVTRGIAGFGANSRIHTATILRLSEDLPVIVDWVDMPARVERVLPAVRAMVGDGLITVEDVTIVQYRHRPIGDISDRVRVREVMTTGVTVVHPETPLREAVELLIDRDFRALPVVDAQGNVAGIVSNSDLIERGGLRLRIELLGTLTRQSLAAELDATAEGRTVADIMTAPVVTLSPEATLAEAAHLMVTRKLKRIPVVDSGSVLLGIVSRVDLLRANAQPFVPPHGPLGEQASRLGQDIGSVMRRGVPSVKPSASLAELVDAVTSTRLNLAIVTDDDERVLGIVRDADLVRRLSPRDHPGLVQILVGRLPFSSLSSEQRGNLERALGATAEALMDTHLTTVPSETSIAQAISLMLRERSKLLVVVDATGRSLGAVDRADLLRLLALTK